MKKSTICQMYYFTMICQIFALICGVAGCILMIIYSNEFINGTGKILGEFFVIGVVCLFLVMIVFSTRALIVLLKDLESLKNKDFISVVGKVIRFKRNREPESGVQINDTPVIRIIHTNDEIELNVNGHLTVGKVYMFNYLKNCRIAEVVKEIQYF